MAINVQMSYNNGTEMVDLFPHSSIEALEEFPNLQSLLAYSFITVTIPAPSTQETTQTIQLSNWPTNGGTSYMLLASSGEQAQYDYNTINQYTISDNQLTITRLYGWPSGSIDVILIIKEWGIQNA